MNTQNNTSPSWSKMFLNNYLTFDSQYAFEMLHSLGSVFDEKLSTNKSLQSIMIELARKDDKRFYALALEAYGKLQHNKSLDLTTIFNQEKFNKMSLRRQDKSDSHYVAVVHVTSNFTRIMPRQWTTGNRAIRHQAFNGINDFCLVYLKSNSSNQAVNDSDQFKNMFLSGIEICNIQYYFIGLSNSQTKNQSYWFVRAENLQDIDQKRKQLGDFSQINNVGKYVARVGLWFSATVPTGITLNYVGNAFGEFARRTRHGEMCVTMIEDVEHDDYCFTDGNGLISKGLAKHIAKKLSYFIKSEHEEIYPSAYQIRMAGCKGLVIIDPDSTSNQFYIKIRPSMKKFECNEWVLEISDRSRPIRTSLNNQIIQLMSDLGVPDSTFFDLQNRWFNDKNRVPRDKTDFLKNKIAMPVNECRYIFGCALESELKANECFIRYQVIDDNGKPLKVPKFETVIGQVIVTKNPCSYAGDMLTLWAVDRPELYCLKDVIVFSTKGDRPACNKIAGSDLDGDQYFIYWGSELKLSRESEPLNYQPMLTNNHSSFKPISSLQVIDHCLSMLGSTIYGEIYNLQQIIIDQNREELEQRTCQKLAKEMAHMFSDAIDAGKTGWLIDKIRIDQIRKICGSKYPDFLMKSPQYESKFILGKLYRNALAFNNQKKSNSNSTIVKADTQKIKQPSVAPVKRKTEVSRIQTVENNLTGVVCTKCQRLCKNNFGLTVHKRTCDTKPYIIKADLPSAVTLIKDVHTTTSKSKTRIIDLLISNSDGTYNCPNLQCIKGVRTFQRQGITTHIKSCAKQWMIQNGFEMD